MHPGCCARRTRGTSEGPAETSGPKAHRKMEGDEVTWSAKRNFQSKSCLHCAKGSGAAANCGMRPQCCSLQNQDRHLTPRKRMQHFTEGSPTSQVLKAWLGKAPPTCQRHRVSSASDCVPEEGSPGCHPS